MDRFERIKELILERKYFIIIGIVLCLMIISVCLYCCSSNETEITQNDFEDIINEVEVVDKQENCLVKVDIKGEVLMPGLYELDCESRVQDVIDLAGGITYDGDTSILNLGKKVIDEMVIIVYSKEEVNDFDKLVEEEKIKIDECINKTEIRNDACVDIVDSSNTNVSNDNFIGDTPVKVLVSLNKATKEELMTLSGIGESKANSIIVYRNENNGFKSIEEIKNVKGIGDSIFDKIKEDITL